MSASKATVIIPTVVRRLRALIDSEQPIQAIDIATDTISAIPDDDSSPDVGAMAEITMEAVSALVVAELNDAGIELENVGSAPQGYYLLANQWSENPSSIYRTKAGDACRAMQAFLWAADRHPEADVDSRDSMFLLSVTVLTRLQVIAGQMQNALDMAEMLLQRDVDYEALPDMLVQMLVLALADVVESVVSRKDSIADEEDARKIDLESTLRIAAHGERIGRPHEQVWSATWRRLALGRTSLLYRLERTDEALASAADAVESAPDARARVVALGEQAELRAKVLGETTKWAPAMEGIFGGGGTIEKVNASIQALAEGRAIADSELLDHAKELISKASEIRAADGMRPTLNLEVRSAIEDGDVARLAHLRPELERLAASSNDNAYEAGFLLAVVANRVDGGDSAELLGRAFDRAMREVQGSEAVALTDSIAQVYLSTPRKTQFAVWRKAAEWLRHVADTLQTQTQWGNWAEQFEATKWLVPTLDVTCHFAVVVADIADSDGSTVLATLHRLHGLLYGQSLQLALATRNNAKPADDELQLARQLSAASVDGGNRFEELRKCLLTAGHHRRCISTAALADAGNGHDDDRISSFPQVVLVETSRFASNSNGEDGALVDRVWKTEQGFDAAAVTIPTDIEAVVEGAFQDLTVDLSLLEYVAPLLEPSASLQPAFGIRSSGLIHAIPFSAVPLADGRYLGEVSVPVILMGHNPELSLLFRPIDLSRLLAVGDAIYDPNQRTSGLSADQVLDPIKNVIGTLDSAWTSINEWNGEGSVFQKSASGLCPLPGTRIEALLAARIAGAINKPLLGKAVSPSSLFASVAEAKPSILHLAVHGIADSENPARSRLMLTGDAEGALAFDEIMLLDLSSTDLVILSACETAQGRIHVGEGVMALAWAFRAAGAKAVIATRWQADDLASVVFWHKFYEALAAGSGLADALLSAQRRLISDPCWEDPYYWACFQLFL